MNPQTIALRSHLRGLSDDEKRAVIAELPDEHAVALAYDWLLEARDAQLPPIGEWTVWLICAGRGYGKTRTGAETIRMWAEENPGCRIALVARTTPDVRDVMVEGESGILAKAPPWFRPTYEPSKRQLTWPNGSIAKTYSAEEPDMLRGPQHHFAWADELAAWGNFDAWDQLMFGLRLGRTPRVIVTTTPRPIKAIKDLLAQNETEGPHGTVRVTTGTTYENRANLAAAFFKKIVSKYEGTRLGKQELEAKILGDTPGALWVQSLLDETRVVIVPRLKRIVVAVDPAVSSTHPDDIIVAKGKKKPKTNETGIIVVGTAYNDQAYVLEDLSGRYPPAEWAKKVCDVAKKYADDVETEIVAEVNNGGELVERNIRTEWSVAPYRAVHASRGKRTRAEPISSLYEQKRVHHAAHFPQLESQMTTWTPDSGEESPDRMDALVWGVTSLLVPKEPDPPRGIVKQAGISPIRGTTRKFVWRGGV